jgi:hypothetical protein
MVVINGPPCKILSIVPSTSYNHSADARAIEILAAISSAIERASALGWIWQHESGTYLKFTERGAALFA